MAGPGDNEPRARAQRAIVLVACAGFVVPPILGLMMIARFFGGMTPGLWILAGTMTVFAVGMLIGLVRLYRKPARRRPCDRRPARPGHSSR